MPYSFSLSSPWQQAEHEMGARPSFSIFSEAAVRLFPRLRLLPPHLRRRRRPQYSPHRW